MKLDKWFTELDSDHTGFISGATAVSFLKRSNLPREILRDIWALVDSQNRGSIDNQQFYKVMRLVAISCVPQHANMKPSWETFHATSRIPFPLPPMGMDPQDTATASSGPAQPPAFMDAEPEAVTSDPLPELVEMKIEEVKWFAELDLDHTGFISGATAVGFLKRSNLPREILRDIWALVDSQNRGSIDNQQFYKVMRLV
ncbi:unnamed protein product, partial [Ectocarpus fasciculatus]